MKITADLSDVQEPVEPGTYHARIINAEQKEWQKSRTQYIQWKFEIFENEDESLNGRNFSHSTPISGPGAFRLADLYEAGTGEKLDKKNPSFDTEQLIGKAFEVTLKQQLDENGAPTKYTEVKGLKGLN